MKNFIWLEIDSSLETNDSKWFDTSCDSTRSNHDSLWLNSKNFRWLWLEGHVTLIGLWLDKNDSGTSLLSVGPKVNGQQNLTGFVDFFTRIWWIMVDMLVIGIQCCGKVLSTWIKVAHSSEKNLIYCKEVLYQLYTYLLQHLQSYVHSTYI